VNMTKDQFRNLISPIVSQVFETEAKGYQEQLGDVIDTLFDGNAEEILSEKGDGENHAELEFLSAQELQEAAALIVPVLQLAKVTAEVYLFAKKEQSNARSSTPSNESLETALFNQLKTHVGAKKAKQVAMRVVAKMQAAE